MNQQPDIDKIYLYDKDIYIYIYKANYQVLIKKRESTGSKQLNGSILE